MKFFSELIGGSKKTKALQQCEQELEEFLRQVPDAGPLNLAVRTLRFLQQQESPAKERVDEALSTTALRSAELLARPSTHQKKRWTLPLIVWSCLLTGVDGRIRVADFDRRDRITFKVDLSVAANPHYRGSLTVREQVCVALKVLVEQAHVPLNMTVAVGLGEIAFSAIDDIDPRKELKLQDLPTLHASFLASSALFPPIQTLDEALCKNSSWTNLSLSALTCVSKDWARLCREQQQDRSDNNAVEELPFCTTAFASRCFICYDKIIPCIEKLLDNINFSNITSNDNSSSESSTRASASSNTAQQQQQVSSQEETDFDATTIEQCTRAVTILSFLHRVFLATAPADVWGGQASESTFRMDQLVEFVIRRVKKIVQHHAAPANGSSAVAKASFLSQKAEQERLEKELKQQQQSHVDPSSPSESPTANNNNRSNSNSPAISNSSFAVNSPQSPQTNIGNNEQLNLCPWSTHCVVECVNFLTAALYLTPLSFGRLVENPVLLQTFTTELRSWALDTNCFPILENPQFYLSRKPTRPFGSPVTATSTNNTNNNTLSPPGAQQQQQKGGNFGGTNSNPRFQPIVISSSAAATQQQQQALPMWTLSEDLALSVVRFRVGYMRTLCSLHEAEELKYFMTTVGISKSESNDPNVQEQYLKRFTALLAECVLNTWSAPPEVPRLNTADAVSLLTVKALVSLAKSRNATGTERELGLTSLTQSRIQALFSHRVIADEGARGQLCQITDDVIELVREVESNSSSGSSSSNITTDLKGVRLPILHNILLQLLTNMLRALNTEVTSARGESFASVLGLTCSVAESMRMCESITCTAFLETQGVAALCRCTQSLCDYVKEAGEQSELVAMIHTTLSGPLNLLKMCAMSPLCLQMSQDDAVQLTDLLAHSLCEKDILEVVTNLISRFHAVPISGTSGENQTQKQSTSASSSSSTLSAIWQAMTRLSRVGTPHERIWIKLCSCIMEALSLHPAGPGRESVLQRLCCIDNSEINIRRKRGLSVAVASPHTPSSYMRTPGGFPFAFVNVLIHLVGQNWTQIESVEARRTFVDLFLAFTSTSYRNLFSAWDASVSWDWVIRHILLLDENCLEFALDLISVCIPHQQNLGSKKSSSASASAATQNNSASSDAKSFVTSTVYLPEFHVAIINYLYECATSTSSSPSPTTVSGNLGLQQQDSTNSQQQQGLSDSERKIAITTLKQVLYRTFQLALSSPEVRWLLVSSNTSLMPTLFTIICNTSTTKLEFDSNFAEDIGNSLFTTSTTSSTSSQKQQQQEKQESSPISSSYDIFKPNPNTASCQSLAISLGGLLLSEHAPAKSIRALLRLVRNEQIPTIYELAETEHTLGFSSSSSNNNSNNNAAASGDSSSETATPTSPIPAPSSPALSELLQAAQNSTNKNDKFRSLDVAKRCMLIATLLKTAIDFGDGSSSRPALLPKSSFLFQSRSPHTFLRLQLSPMNQTTLLLGAGPVPPFWFSLRFCLAYHSLERASILATIRHRKLNARISLFVEPVSAAGKISETRMNLYDDAADLRIGFIAQYGDNKTIRQVSLGIFRPLSWFHAICAFSAGRVRVFMKGEAVIDVGGIDLPNFFEHPWDLIIGTRSCEQDSMLLNKPCVPFCGQLQHLLLGLSFFEPHQARLINSLKSTDAIFVGRGTPKTFASSSHHHQESVTAGGSHTQSNLAAAQQSSSSAAQHQQNISTTSATTSNVSSPSTAAIGGGSRRPDEELLRSICVCLDANRNFGQQLCHRVSRHEVSRLPIPPVTTWSWTETVPFSFVVADGVIVRSSHRPIATLISLLDSFVRGVAAPMIRSAVWPAVTSSTTSSSTSQQLSQNPATFSSFPSSPASTSTASKLKRRSSTVDSELISSAFASPTTTTTTSGQLFSSTQQQQQQYHQDGEVIRASALISVLDFIISAFSVAEVRSHVVYNVDCVNEIGAVISSAITHACETSPQFREGKTSSSIPSRLGGLLRILYGRSQVRPEVLVRLTSMWLTPSVWGKAKSNVVSLVLKEIATLPMTQLAHLSGEPPQEAFWLVSNWMMSVLSVCGGVEFPSEIENTNDDDKNENEQKIENDAANCRSSLYRFISATFASNGCSSIDASVIHHILTDINNWCDFKFKSENLTTNKKNIPPQALCWFPATAQALASTFSSSNKTGENNNTNQFAPLGNWTWNTAREFIVSMTKILTNLYRNQATSSSSSSSTTTSTNKKQSSTQQQQQQNITNNRLDMSSLWKNILSATGLIALRLTVYEELRHEAMLLVFAFSCYSDEFKKMFAVSETSSSSSSKVEISLEPIHQYFSSFVFDSDLCYAFLCGIRSHFASPRLVTTTNELTSNNNTNNNQNSSSSSLIAFARKPQTPLQPLRGHERHLSTVLLQLLIGNRSSLSTTNASEKSSLNASPDAKSNADANADANEKSISGADDDDNDEKQQEQKSEQEQEQNNDNCNISTANTNTETNKQKQSSSSSCELTRSPIVFLSTWMDEDSSMHRANILSKLPTDVLFRAFLSALGGQQQNNSNSNNNADEYSDIDELVECFARIMSSVTLRSTSGLSVDSRLIELGDALTKDARVRSPSASSHSPDTSSGIFMTDSRNTSNDHLLSNNASFANNNNVNSPTTTTAAAASASAAANASASNNNNNNNSSSSATTTVTTNNVWTEAILAGTLGRGILVECLAHMIVDLRMMLNTPVPAVSILIRARAVLTYVDFMCCGQSQRLRTVSVMKHNNNSMVKNSNASLVQQATTSSSGFVEVTDSVSSTSPTQQATEGILRAPADERTIRLAVLCTGLVAHYPAIVELNLAAPSDINPLGSCESQVLSIILRLLKYVLEETSRGVGDVSFGSDALTSFAQICTELSNRLSEVKAEATNKLFSVFKKQKGPTPAQQLRAKFGLASIDLVSRCRAQITVQQTAKACDNVKTVLRNFIGQDTFGVSAEAAVDHMLSLGTCSTVLDDAHERRALAAVRRAMALQQFESSATNSEEDAIEVLRGYSKIVPDSFLFKKQCSELLEQLWNVACVKFWSGFSIAGDFCPNSSSNNTNLVVYQHHLLNPGMSVITNFTNTNNMNSPQQQQVVRKNNVNSSFTVTNATNSMNSNISPTFADSNSNQVSNQTVSSSMIGGLLLEQSASTLPHQISPSIELTPHHHLAVKTQSITEIQKDIPAIGGPPTTQLGYPSLNSNNRSTMLISPQLLSGKNKSSNSDDSSAQQQQQIIACVLGSASTTTTFTRIPSRTSYLHAAKESKMSAAAAASAGSPTTTIDALAKQQEKGARRVKKKEGQEDLFSSGRFVIDDDDDDDETGTEKTEQDNNDVNEEDFEEEVDSHVTSPATAIANSSTGTSVAGSNYDDIYDGEDVISDIHTSPAPGISRSTNTNASFAPSSNFSITPTSASHQQHHQHQTSRFQDLQHFQQQTLQQQLRQQEETKVDSWLTVEIPFLMQCRSAAITLTTHQVLIELDQENTSYNPPISPDSLDYLPTPPALISIPLHSIKILSTARRFRMRYTAVVFENDDLTEAMVCFKSIQDHDHFVTCFRQIRNQHRRKNRDQCKILTQATRHSEKSKIRDSWVNGKLSNFQYLLELNHLAHRTVLDFSQYPVFPWVVSDYSSKRLDLENPETFRRLDLPMGLQGDIEKREQELTMRFHDLEDMGDIPFHYFTHYSTVAVVLFYLIRYEPFTAGHVVLQGGRFDHADRMFHSIKTSWQGVSTSHQDVKELIPEFFSSPEFLRNQNNIPFGARQNGERMNSVALPPWAENSPWIFVAKMREALESEFVTARLHYWIDLIFGYKQRGPAAVGACNLFHPDTYEGDTVTDDTNDVNDEARKQVIDTLDNIGQCPAMIFKKAHQAHKMRNFVRKSPLGNPMEVNVKEIIVPNSNIIGGSGSSVVGNVVGGIVAAASSAASTVANVVSPNENALSSNIHPNSNTNTNINLPSTPSTAAASGGATTTSYSSSSGNVTTAAIGPVLIAAFVLQKHIVLFDTSSAPYVYELEQRFIEKTQQEIDSGVSVPSNQNVQSEANFFDALRSSSNSCDVKHLSDINGLHAIHNSVHFVGGAVTSVLPPIVPSELLYVGRQVDKAVSLSSTLVRRSDREVVPLAVSRPNTVAVLATADEKQIYAVVPDDKSCVLVGLRSRYRTRLTHHTEPISCMHVSSDNTWLVTGSLDCMCCVYSVEDLTGTTRDGIVQISCSCVIQSHCAPITSVFVSSSLDTIISGDSCGVVQFHTLRRNNNNNQQQNKSAPFRQFCVPSPGLVSSLQNTSSQTSSATNTVASGAITHRSDVLSVLLLEKAYLPSVLIVLAHSPSTIYQMSLNGTLIKQQDLGLDCRFAHWCQTCDPRYFLVAVTSSFGFGNLSTYEQVGSVVQTRSTTDLSLIQNLLPSVLGSKESSSSLSNNNNTMLAVASHPTNPQVSVAVCSNGKMLLVGTEKAREKS